MSGDKRIPDHSVSGDGPVTIYLLHGAFGAKEYWRSQIAALAGAGFRVVAWDAPGYGISPLPTPYSADVAARAFGHLLDATGGSRNVLLGHSMGGMIAQRAYDFFPDRIHGLILSATSAAFGNPGGEWQKKFVADRVAPLDAGKTIPEYAPTMLRRMMAPAASGENVDLLISIVSAMREETFRAAIAAIAEFDARAVLPKISVPVLCIAGEHDATAPAEVMAKMAGKIRGAQFVTMSGVGHFPWAERAQEFNTLVLDFLKAHFSQ